MSHNALQISGVVYGLPSLPDQIITVNDAPPQWGNVYSIQGILRLPYAEIEEPFAGYYDATNKRSRVDYYGGKVYTFECCGYIMKYAMSKKHCGKS